MSWPSAWKAGNRFYISPRAAHARLPGLVPLYVVALFPGFCEGGSSGIVWAGVGDLGVGILGGGGKNPDGGKNRDGDIHGEKGQGRYE
ncbi:hypothetical protein EJ06DRAFT_10631 [Trichodelitschia bisporula]|uniref:Uncharacterized protein n=1 Tax=Trichodelitschia bisporula TaxID=703511 RepID=A0A6G1I9Q8_9PEZI|nr:hypothetical protein EJ06DRAFT_10631 [Trichodelitschia bisporula]